MKETLEHFRNLPNKDAEWDEVKASMTPERARLIKQLREHHECSWRRVAEDCNYIFHGLNEHGCQHTGRLLCAVAADYLGEDWD